MDLGVHILGYPGPVGGANTELWHTVRLWRANGVKVTLTPTWKPNEEWYHRLSDIGCRTLHATPETLQDVPGLAGATVVSFCNTPFLKEAYRLQAIGCQIVWVNCMCWPFPAERMHYREHPVFDRYVFHSQYQRDRLLPFLRRMGARDEQCCQIRGAFWADDFRISGPHVPGERFIVGRISRAGVDKFPADLWQQYERIPYPTSARVLGWSDEIAEKCDPPPRWATVIPQGEETTQDFFSKIHALVPGIDCCAENWPRVGLEAMACGIPIVAERKGGWSEMLQDGGVLVKDRYEQAYEVARLARDSQHYERVRTQQRENLQRLANADAIWAGWKTLFEGLQT